jgi:hypothetical protein
MVRAFDILKVGDDGKTTFLEAALTLDAAMARAQELAALQGGTYQIYSHVTGITSPVKHVPTNE